MAKIFFFNIVQIRTTVTISYNSTTAPLDVILAETDLPVRVDLGENIGSISSLERIDTHQDPNGADVVIWGQKKNKILSPDLNIIGVEIQDGNKGKS